MSCFRKMPLPYPNRADSLWRHCMFAYAAGWEVGFRADGSLQSAGGYEHASAQRPVWVGSLDDGNYENIDMGRVLNAGGASTDQITFNDTVNLYDTVGPVSAAVLWRPQAINNAEGGIITKYPDATPPSGWGMAASIPAGSGYIWGLNNGAVQEFQVNGLQTTAESNLLALTYDRVNLLGYYKGILRGSVATTAAISNNNNSIALFGDGANNRFDGWIGMAAAWRRKLSPQEVERLTADPFIMWRSDLHKEFMFQRFAQVGQGTYFLIF